MRLDNQRVAAQNLLDGTSIPHPPKQIAQGVTQDNEIIRREIKAHLQLHSVSECDGVNHISSRAVTRTCGTSEAASFVPLPAKELFASIPKAVTTGNDTVDFLFQS